MVQREPPRCPVPAPRPQRPGTPPRRRRDDPPSGGPRRVDVAMRLLPEHPPPGPSEEDFWTSPLRGPWLTAVLGHDPARADGRRGLDRLPLARRLQPRPRPQRDRPPRDHDLDLLVFDWPTRPAWLYALTQGTARRSSGSSPCRSCWRSSGRSSRSSSRGRRSRSPAQALERLSLLLLVGGAFFEFGTGILNIQLWYPWHFNFVVAHYYGAWVFLAALVVHVAIKLPAVRAPTASAAC